MYFLLAYTVSSLKALLTALYPVRASWYNIGLVLNIPYRTLDLFKENHTDQSVSMREMLKHWLGLAEDPCPSWEAVVRALRSPLVNERRLAAQLEFKYCVTKESSNPAKLEEYKGIAILIICVKCLGCFNLFGLGACTHYIYISRTNCTEE